MARILIGYSACDLTRNAFERHGHEVWTCDLLPARDGHSNHYQRDIWTVLVQRWDMAVLHPMCTYLTVSSAWAFNDPDYDRYPGVGYHQKVKPSTLTGTARRLAREAALDNFRRLLALPYPVAIENPAPSSLNRAVRAPDQIVQPYQFGDDASKGTGLWLKGLPRLKETKYVKPRLVCENGHVFEYGHYHCPTCASERYLPRWANQTNSGQNRLSPSEDRWLERSKTYPGIAAAMGEQWGRLFAAAPTQQQERSE
ncbi:MAG: hypothetical protein I4O48_17665 [Ralstonia sp.]|nr:hypothetical protein [Ralstonia sp.]